MRTPRYPDRPSDLNAPLVPPRYTIFFWLGLRKIISSAFFDPLEVQQIYGSWRGKVPNFKVVNFTLAAREVQEARIATGANFVLLALIGSSSSALGFKGQFYDSSRKKALSDLPVNFTNLLGTAKNPFFLRRPYPFPENANLLVKAQNLDTVTNTAQIVFYGLLDETSILHLEIREKTGWTPEALARGKRELNTPIGM